MTREHLIEIEKVHSQQTIESIKRAKPDIEILIGEVQRLRVEIIRLAKFTRCTVTKNEALKLVGY